ncbi:LPXTG cell wall anchor domain-containing protein [Embleya sp. NPDC001921]
MQLHISRHISGAVGVGVLALALPVVMAGTAEAKKDHDTCARVGVEYSLDGGKHWTTSGRMDGTLVTRIEVRLKDKPKNKCEYAVSLASYNTEGPTWPTSGTQKFLGWDSKKLSKNNPKVTLDVSAYRPTCFGQVDLYGNGKKYDGVANPLPAYPRSTIANLITAWNGGDKCAPPTTPPTTTPPTTKPPTTKPPVETTKPPVETTKPPVETTKPPTESTKPPVETSKPATSSSAPAVEETSSTPPVGKPEVTPVDDTAPASLAETGSDNSSAIVLGASAGVLLVGGLGAFAWSRRRNTTGTGTTA